MKKLVCILLIMCFVLSGCQNEESAEILNRLNSLQGVNTGFAEGQSLSFTERQALLYKRLRNHQLLKLTGLGSCTAEEISGCLDLIDEVDRQLCGQVHGDDAKVDEAIIDYMLLAFESTPYYWQRSSVSIQGKDNAADYIVVDVTYHTIGYEKDVLRDSSIVMGCPDYEKRMKIRMDRGLAIFEELYKNNTPPDDPRVADDIKDFINAYGTFEEVYQEQNNYSPSQYMYILGNQKTTSGVVKDTGTTGVITFRFILNQKLVYGINMGMECQHVYMLNQQLNESLGSMSQAILDMAGYNTLANAVYDLVKSYFTCVDEANYTGLYKLVNDFGRYDKYYQDWFKYAYRNHDNFRVEITSIEGTCIKGKVIVSSGERPRDTKMTLPLYTDTFAFEINLYGDELKFSDMHLSSRIIDGEPVIEVHLGEETGFSYEVSLSNQDKAAIEDIIARLGVIQLKGIETSDEFINIIDLAISEADMTALKQNVFAIKGDHKSVWIQSYIQGNSNYALVQCKEQVHGEDGIHEYVTRYEFILRGGIWALLSYTVTSSVKLSLKELSTAGSMCVCSATEIESYTTQALDGDIEVSDSVVHEVYTQDYPEYKPARIIHTSFDADAQTIILDGGGDTRLNDLEGTVTSDSGEGTESGSGEETGEGTDITPTPTETPTDTTTTVSYEINPGVSTPEDIVRAFSVGNFTSEAGANYLTMYTSEYTEDAIKTYVQGLKGKNWSAKFYDVDAAKDAAEAAGASKEWSAFVKVVNNYWDNVFTSKITFDYCDEYVLNFTEAKNALMEKNIDISQYLKKEAEEENTNENN